MALALYILFFLTVFPVVLAGVAVNCRLRQFGTIDNNNPRAQQGQLEGIGARAMAAQQNAWEAAILFVVTLFIAYSAGLPLTSLDVPAVLYMVFRLGHAVCYLADWATLRSIVYCGGFFTCVYIVYLAA